MPSSRFAAEVERLTAVLRGKPPATIARAMRKHLDALPVAALAADEALRYVAVNGRAEDLTGYSASELTAMSVIELTPVVNAVDGADLWDDFISAGEQQGHYDLRRKDGSLVRVQYWAYARVAPGVHLSLLIPEVTMEFEP